LVNSQQNSRKSRSSHSRLHSHLDFFPFCQCVRRTDTWFLDPTSCLSRSKTNQNNQSCFVCSLLVSLFLYTSISVIVSFKEISSFVQVLKKDPLWLIRIFFVVLTLFNHGSSERTTERCPSWGCGRWSRVR
jgi:hypothetical protein